MERKACKACGNPLIEVLANRLYRCSVCGLYHHVRDQTGTSPLALDREDFERFLQRAARYGAPETLSAFERLPDSKKQFYLNAYEQFRMRSQYATSKEPLCTYCGKPLVHRVEIERGFCMDCWKEMAGVQEGQQPVVRGVPRR